MLAAQGATLDAIDISNLFIESAQQMEMESPLWICYLVASATSIPFENESFDFATSFMCLMDLPEQEKVIAEAYRVLKPGGFFQFSIEHPCFTTPYKRKVQNAQGDVAFEVGKYFKNSDGKIKEWIFGDAPDELKDRLPKFSKPNFNHTLSWWISTLISVGFSIEKLHEPYPDEETVLKKPALKGRGK